MQYYRRDAESCLGEGVAFMEVDSARDLITRQVEVYGGCSFWADVDGQSDERFMLADQPPSMLGFTAEHQIEVESFDAVWEEARAEAKSEGDRCP